MDRYHFGPPKAAGRCITATSGGASGSPPWRRPGDLTLLDDFIATRDVAFGLWFTGTAQANPAFRADLHEVQQNISDSLDTLTRH